mgnify:CR=1 FL=1
MRQFLEILNNFKKEEKKDFIFVFFLMFLIFFFEFLGLGLLYPIISFIIKEDFIGNFNHILILDSFSKKEIILFSLLLLFFVYLIKNILSVYFSYKKKKLLVSININFTQRLFKYFLYRDYSFFLKKDKSEVIRDASIMPQYSGIIESFLNLIMEFIIITFILLIILFTDLKIGIFLILSTYIIYLFQSKIMRPRLVSYGRETNELNKQTYSSYLGIFSSIKNIILRNNQDFFSHSFIKIFKKSENIRFKNDFINEMPKYIIEIFLITSICLLFFILVSYNNNYQDVLFKVTFFTALLFKAMPSLSKIINNLSNINFKLDLVNRVNQMIIGSSVNYESHQIKTKNKKEMDFKVLEFKNVNFKYTTDEILKSINFKLEKNRTVGIVGESGSGKSTLVDIISGLMPPTSGKIILNEKEILGSENLYSYQNKIAYISQNNFLLSDTIKNNILFGISENEINNDQFAKAVEISKVSDFVNKFEKGYEYEIIDNGKNLSGGQRQRLVMARALYRNASIFLFDEPTSSLDAQTEKDIFEVINNDFHHKKTMIIISHKESLLEFADEIYRIENNMIKKIR